MGAAKTKQEINPKKFVKIGFPSFWKQLNQVTLRYCNLSNCKRIPNLVHVSRLQRRRLDLKDLSRSFLPVPRNRSMLILRK